LVDRQVKMGQTRVWLRSWFPELPELRVVSKEGFQWRRGIGLLV